MSHDATCTKCGFLFECGCRNPELYHDPHGWFCPTCLNVVLTPNPDPVRKRPKRGECATYPFGKVDDD